jgi:hypothetical protein
MSKELLTCPLCGSNQFKKEEGRMDSKWGFTSHKITLMVCERCKFIMQFSKGRSIFDFD